MSDPGSVVVPPPDSMLRRRYLALTLFIFLPLLWSFITLTSRYPFTAWTMMMSGGSLQRPWTYYLVRGETVSGQMIDIRPSELTDALSGRMWSLVAATINNESLKISTPHPDNARMIAEAGGAGNVSRGVHVPELLKAWGDLYNARLPASSADRLKAIRVDVYRWESGRFENYDKFIETWRTEL